MIIYIVFGIVWAFVLYFISAEAKLEKLGIEKQRFDRPFFNWMYRYSNIAPFIWFADDDADLTKKGEGLKSQLKTAGFLNIFTVRSYMAFTFLLLVLSILSGAAVVVATQYSDIVLQVLFNVKPEEGVEEAGIDIRQSTMIMMVSMALALVPNQILKQRSKKAFAMHRKELPVIQMFLILMMRSGKTVEEILYALSKLETHHKKVFEHGYRIYVRNPQEAMDYLRSNFENSRFRDVFDLLEDISEYARIETITIMESGMRALIDETNQIKRKNDLSGLVYSQSSMVAPFAAIILLGAVPILIMGLTLFSSSMSM